MMKVPVNPYVMASVISVVPAGTDIDWNRSSWGVVLGVGHGGPKHGVMNGAKNKIPGVVVTGVATTVTQVPDNAQLEVTPVPVTFTNNA
jgi:hypothetical protein